MRRHSNGKCTILSVYADDIIITGDDTSGIVDVKKQLGMSFDVTLVLFAIFLVVR